MSFKDLKLELLGELSAAQTVDDVINALKKSPLPVDIQEDETFVKKYRTVPDDGVATSNQSILSLEDLLTKFRDAAKAKGAHGVSGLMRTFKQLDVNGNRQLDFPEFLNGTSSLGLALNHSEVKALFKHFDRNCNGHLDLEEFLAGVRGNLNDRRTELVNQAFDVFDINKDGLVNMKDLIGRYDASQHPEVIAGRMTEGQVFRLFLDTFDGGEKDGMVSREEFTQYYTGVSAGIPLDDYFELMIRNAWHLSGGEGWSENTTCRRVLVTHMDGHQTVEEITNDFDIGKDDIEAMKSNLAARGIEAKSISVNADVDEPTPEVTSPQAGEYTRSRYGRGAGQSSIQFG